MESKSPLKRLFFGMEIKAPWPEKFAKGRLIEEKSRHLTLAFLGNCDYHKLDKLLSEFPKPKFEWGLVGILDKCLFLPSHHPHVVAYQAKWLEDTHSLISYKDQLVSWLRQHQFSVKEHERFLPHVSVCRRPFDLIGWKKSFIPLPFMATTIHLYESLGLSLYQSLWHHTIREPFFEIEHTADVGFMIYGKTITELHRHAQMALAFVFPQILSYLSETKIEIFDDIVLDLNHSIAKADGDIGCPFKAVSFHGMLKQEPSFFSWEMIIDV